MVLEVVNQGKNVGVNTELSDQRRGPWSSGCTVPDAPTELEPYPCCYLLQSKYVSGIRLAEEIRAGDRVSTRRGRKEGNKDNHVSTCRGGGRKDGSQAKTTIPPMKLALQS